MPAHLVRHLIAIGRMDADGVSRRAHATSCAKCGAVVMVGLDHDSCAMTVYADPVPLTPIGEVEVLLAGRRTYDLAYTSRGYRLDPRFAAHIKATPAGSAPGVDVVAGHRCGAPRPSNGQSQILAAYRPSESVEECPF